MKDPQLATTPAYAPPAKQRTATELDRAIRDAETAVAEAQTFLQSACEELGRLRAMRAMMFWQPLHDQHPAQPGDLFPGTIQGSKT